ncbi:MAG: tetratricopeptide repeat protein [Verrucomicrobiales bacterium]|nr:tetratricopeptide repeat protein [Verrucomicrobiales bacterium]MCP5558588.1 tetratricopeptide repeat protein [Verrucomicrobiaceae bacterium]
MNLSRIVCLSVLLASGTRVWSQAAPPAAPAAPAALNKQAEAEALQSAALAAFQEGKYQEALSKVEAIKAMVTKPFDALTFIEGACHFNLNDYAKAIASFEFYIQTFPDGENINPVKMGLGRAQIVGGDAEKGVAILKEVVGAAPDLKGEAGLIIADYYFHKANKPDEAIKILTSVLEGGIRTAEGIQAALMAADIYVAQGEVDKASGLMDKVRSASSGGDNVAQMNNISLKLGDQMLERKSFREALAAYQMVRRQSEITRMQKERIAKIEQSLANPGKGPVRGSKDELEARMKSEQELLTELEKRPDYDASLYYRLGRCYFEMGRMWEAILAFNMIVEDFKTFPQRDKCMYGTILANAQLKRVKQARELCERFINDFPDSSEIGQISELFGMLAYDNKQLDEAEQAFDTALGFPKADKERLLFLRANVLFELQRFVDARNCLENVLAINKDSAYKDDAQYRIALTYFYQNDSKGVSKALKQYLEENPKGQYVIDAKYRLAFIKFQAKDTDGAMQDLEALVQEGPNDPNIGQVYALLGDGYNQRQEYDKALEAFAAAVSKAKTPEVMKYAMDNATDLYSANGQWKELAEMWEKFYETAKDDEQQALKAIYWISRARAREGNIDSAKKLMSEAIKPKMANAANEQVEVLIQQLCSLMVPKKRRATPAAAPAADGKPAETPAPAPAIPTFDEIDKELQDLITPPQEGMNGTAQARILFARGWMARLMKDAKKAENFFNILIGVAKPEDLSPLLLSLVGDSARKQQDFEKAAGCYQRLEELFKDSEFADGAAVGLAEIAFEKGENDQALTLFDKAINEYAGSSRLLDAYLGKAKTLFNLKKYDEAKELYIQIQNTKEWRGEATATALFMQGEIEMAKKSPGTAISFYQRMILTQPKWKSWLAKSYLQCAKAFIALNRPAELPDRKNSDKEAAKLTLYEATKRNDIKDFPEFKQMQDLLKTL